MPLEYGDMVLVGEVYYIFMDGVFHDINGLSYIDDLSLDYTKIVNLKPFLDIHFNEKISQLHQLIDDARKILE